MRHIHLALMTVGLLLAFAAPARALTPDASLYCSAGGSPGVNSDTSGKTLKLTDVTLTINSTVTSAANCYGDYNGGATTTANQTGNFNDIFGTTAYPYVYLDSSLDVNGFYMGQIKFVINESPPGANCATYCWRLSWSDVDNTPPNLPIELDFGVTLLGTDGEAASYLFAPIVIGTNPSNFPGNFTIDFAGINGTNPDTFRNIELFGRIPEPASTALLGFGLAALGLARRRRRLG